jgi:hypothetical protein
MALMRPTDPVFEGGGSQAERRFFEAARDELSDDWIVYHGLPYYDLKDGVRCGEIDFLLLHPDHGLLVVECKGTGVTYRQGQGRWYRHVDGGDEEPLKHGPLRQAERQAYDFVRFLERQLPVRFPELHRFPFVFGFAAAFPLVGRFPAPQPPDLAPELVFTAKDRGGLERKAVDILARFAAKLRTHPPGLQGRAFKIFRKHVLRPTFHLSAGMGGQVADDEQTFVRLSELQARVVHQFLENRVIRVRGGAGTGKTMLAMEAGERVLLLCYNKYLGAYLRARTDRWEFDEGRVLAAHFHGLCARSHELTGQPFHPPDKDEAYGEERRRFWNVDAPQVLWQAIESRRIGPFDAIVVDEGQDFESDWWTVLRDALASPDKGRLVVFYDPAQDLFGRQCELPAGASFVLVDNFRNTQQISELINRLGFTPLKPHLMCPMGNAPTVRAQGTPAETRKELDSLIRRLTGTEGFAPGQIVLLTPRTRPHSSLAGLETLADLRLAHDPHDREGRLLHCTVGRFKGLESDVVILLDIDPAHERSGREVRYCGASRARHLLYVFVKGKWEQE